MSLTTAAQAGSSASRSGSSGWSRLGNRAASRTGTARLSLIGNTAIPQPMSEPTSNGYSNREVIAAPIGAPLPGCRSGIPATWITPSRAATCRHCARASDSIQLVGDANTATVAGAGTGGNSRRES